MSLGVDILIGVAIFFVVMIVLIIGIYNTLVSKREGVRNDSKQIDIQLDRRFKVLESLISAVNKYMNHEKTTLKDVISCRNQAQSAKDSGDMKGRMAAENKISGLIGGLNMQFEAYPQLKASQNVSELTEEIVNTENKLTYAKQAYNDGVERFNIYVRKFPINMISGMFSGSFPAFFYWKLQEDDAKKKEDYIARM